MVLATLQQPPMVPLPRLRPASPVIPASPAEMKAWADAMANALEIQMRRLIAAPASSTFAGFAGSWDWPVTATGKNQAGAYLIKAQLTVVTSAPPVSALPSGVVLFPMTTVLWGYVLNADPSNLLEFYPSGSGTINGGAASAPIVIPPGTVGNWYANASNTVFMR
jgi:hypothetical protein